MQIQRSLKVAAQADKKVKKAYRILVLVSWGNEYKGMEDMLQLYKILVGPQLDCCMHFWSSHDWKNVIMLAKVQRRFWRGYSLRSRD